MSPTRISSDRVHNFNRVTLAIDRQLEAEFEIDLLLMPEELRKNSIVAAQWHTAGDKQVCPLCASLEGDVIPVDSPEYGRIAPPIHLNCRCILSYITARERGVQARIDTYRPIDPDLLKKWSSKVYTDAEIREMVKAEPKLPFKIEDSKHEKEITEQLAKKLSPQTRERLNISEIKFQKSIPDHPNWRGVYRPADKTMGISRNWVDVDDALGKKTIFHEFAHSLEPNFTAAEARELNRLLEQAMLKPELLITDYAVTSSSEFWAENFGYFMIRPDAVMKKNRAMYDFVANILARLSRGM